MVIVTESSSSIHFSLPKPSQPLHSWHSLLCQSSDNFLTTNSQSFYFCFPFKIPPSTSFFPAITDNGSPTTSKTLHFKGIYKAVYCHPVYLTYIWRIHHVKCQAGWSTSWNHKRKIARRNINNLRYADDATLMAESEEELKSFLMKVKEESKKVGLKLKA